MKQSGILLLLLCISQICMAQADTQVYIKKAGSYQQGKTNILVSPKGKPVVITVLPKGEGWLGEAQWIEEDALDDIDTMVAKGFRRTVNPGLTQEQKNKIKANQCRNAQFAGLSRSKVKTSLAKSTSTVTYHSLQQFMNSLPKDADMRMVVNALQKPHAERAVQENKLVSVRNLYLYAYAREEDNDYHLILTNKDKTLFFNAEISGLPGTRAASYTTLKKVRAAFEQYPGWLRCGSYVLPRTPIAIAQIKGALFFDIDHPAGQVGPAGARPLTAWEIHPVTFIEFD